VPLDKEASLMSMMLGSTVFIVVSALVVVGIVVALIVRVGRGKTDWAGEPRPPQPQPQPQPQPPRSIDDSQRFREQNRPTDPPASA